MMNNPPVTVLMCAFNAEKHIGAAIESVLNQSFSHFSFLIINDGSTDRTEEIIRSFSDERIKWINQSNQGISTALNTGIDLISSPFIARFDADDICYPHRLEKQMNFLLDHPHCSITGSAADYIDEDGNYLFTYCPPGKTSEDLARQSTRICPFIHSTVMYRREAMIQYRYDPNAYSFEDHLLWTHVLQNHQGINLQEPLIQVRLHSASITLDDKQRPKRFQQIKYKALQTGRISEEDGKELRCIAVSQYDPAFRKAAYHALLAKKYLWNNPQPSKARQHIWKAIRIRPLVCFNYLMLVATYLPQHFLQILYVLSKSENKITGLANHFVSKLKGHEYKIDDRIPSGYLLSLIGNRVVMLIYGYLSRLNHKGMLFLSPSAKIKAPKRLQLGKGVTIGPGTYIDALSEKGIRLGNHVSLGRNTRIEGTGHLQTLGKGLLAEDRVGLGSDCFYGCAGGITIGHDTIIGNFVSFHSENHRFSDTGQLIRMQGVNHKGITIGPDCWIGAKSTILDGACIEEGCIIAAGSLVKAGRYEAFGIYAGVPAKLVKRRKEPFTHAQKEETIC